MTKVDFKYDPQADAGTLVFGSGRAIESEEAAPGVILDFNERNELVAIEIVGVSKVAPGLLATKPAPVGAK